MASFYSGYRPILKGRDANLEFNTYTGKLGTYSNWDLMDPSHAFDGAPDKNHIPGSGPYGEGDLFLSKTFDGTFTQLYKSSLMHPHNLTQNDFYGRYITELFRGVYSSQVFKAGYGHVKSGGPLAAYALFSNYTYYGLSEDQALQTSTLGHIERYPNDFASSQTLGLFSQPTGTARTFGAFEPYIYKGVINHKSDPLGPLNTGHAYYAPSVQADQMPADYGEIPAPRNFVEHYGDEHVREWFGVPSAKAL